VARPYITPSDIPTARQSRCLSFPDSLEWDALINGFLAMGTRIENWQQLDGITPEAAVAACVELLNEFFEAGACEVPPIIGTIIMWASNTIPAGWLLCDGSNYLRDDYPELSLLFPVGGTWGGSASEISLPDFRGRSPMQPTLGTLDDVGKINGAATHTLTTNEIPAHNHAITDPGHAHAPLSPFTGFFGNRPSGAASVAAGATFSGSMANTASNTTGISTTNTGDGASHNNVHPVLGINFIIYAGV